MNTSLRPSRARIDVRPTKAKASTFPGRPSAIRQVPADLPYRVVLVSGDDVQSQLVTMVLSSNDMRVILAQSGCELSKTIATEMPHLILIDWDEEGIDGRSNLRAIRTRQESRKIPVVVMTDVAVTEHLARELGMLGVQWILEKPIVPLSLPKLIVRTVSGVSASGQSIVPSRGRAFLVNCGQTATGVQWQAV